MKKMETHRGFTLYEFKDRYGASCSLQKSSIATEDCIWLGVDDPDPRKLIKNKGWQSVKIDEDILLTTRMHLSIEQVKALLPILNEFVEKGEIG